MSLIHEALKKAEKKEGVGIGSGLSPFQEGLDGGSRRIPTRTIVLIAFLVMAVGFFVYTKCSSEKPSAVSPDAATVPSAATDQAGLPTDAESLKQRAVRAFKEGNYDVAWSNLSTAANLSPDDSEIWNNLGLVSKMKGDLQAARQAYQRAMKLKPDYIEAMNNLAVVEMADGNDTNARKLLQDALSISPAYPEANFNMALIYDEAGDKEKAIEYYTRFLEVSGDYPSNVVDEVRDHIMNIQQ